MGGAAVFLSYPHFYQAEAQTDHFTGLAPDAEKHKLFLNVEPYTGQTLRMHSKIQLNVPLLNSADLAIPKYGITFDIPTLNSVPSIPAFPVLWIDLGADIDS